MPTTLLISPPASGKTRRCITIIQQRLDDRPLAHVRVILPDRLQIAAFRQRLAIAGGAMGPRIGTFGDFYQALLLDAKKPVPLTSDPVIYRLLHAAVDAAAANKLLPHYGPIAKTPGFINILRERFAELKRARIFPEDLVEMDFPQDPGLNDLAQIYLAYQTRLRELNWADPEGLSWLAVEAHENHPGLASDIDLVIVDGFDSFNRAQLDALKLLSQDVPQILITLPGEPDIERSAHRRFARALEQIQQTLPEAEVETLPEPPHLPATLARLETALFEPDPRPEPLAAGHLSLIETRTPVDEVREALRWVKARIVRDHVSPDACAIITPNPETYRQILRETAAEFGLPLRFTHGELLTGAPGIAALLDLLELPLQDWPGRLTVDVLRMPYFDLSQFGLSPQGANRLDLVSRAEVVVTGLDQWEEALTRLAGKGEQAQEFDDEAYWVPMLPADQEAFSLWGGLESFAARLQPPELLSTFEWVGWLEDLLEDLDFFARQETDRDQTAALGLREILRALVLGEAVAPSGLLNYGPFLGELRSSLEGANYQEQIHWRQPAVQTLRVLEARGLRYKAVAVLGISEGLFPEVEREDPIFREEIRDELGLEPRLGREQAGLFYQAVTRADEFLLLTRPTLAGDGERWEPSPYWTAAAALFSDEPLLIRPDDPRPLADAASPEEVLFMAVRRGSMPAVFGELMPRFERLRLARDVLAARLEEPSDSPFDGNLWSIHETLAGVYGPGHVWSASRLEAYTHCPHRFFAGNLLELEAPRPPEPGLDAAQLGQLLHAIFEAVYEQARDPANPDSVLAEVESVTTRIFATAPEDYGFRPAPVWEVEKEYLVDRVRVAIRVLGEEPGWKPTAFEHIFGRDDIPFEMEVPDGFIRLSGLIDRVDVNGDGQLRVIDYKTGSSGLTKGDLVQGKRLQLPIYAHAAERALGLGTPVEGLYYAILAGEVGSLKLSKFKFNDGEHEFVGPEGALAVAQQHAGRAVRGVQSGAFPPVPPRGGCPSYCPAAAWCWHYNPSAW